MNIYEKLLAVQTELKAPKGQYNSFGRYNYRSCEDILEAVKPINKKYKATVILSDSVVLIGDRFYIQATANFIDVETAEQIEVTALAREEAEKKGMDGSQVTGASSSYARKYALNGLFNIDDNKDSDSTNTHGAEEKKQPKQTSNAAEELRKLAKQACVKAGMTDKQLIREAFSKCNIEMKADTTEAEFKKVIAFITMTYN